MQHIGPGEIHTSSQHLVASVRLTMAAVASRTLTLLVLMTYSVYAQQIDCEADVVFAVDCSGSISDSIQIGSITNWQRVITFLQTLSGNLTIGPNNTRVSLIIFGNNATLEFGLDEHTNVTSLRAVFGSIPNRGGRTNTTGAARLARTTVFEPAAVTRPEARRVLILVTDGIPTVEPNQLLPEIVRNKMQGTEILGVGVSHHVNMTLMRMIVSDPNAGYFHAESFAALTDLPSRVARGVCPQSTDPTITPPDCADLSDVVFVVDNSASIGPLGMRTMMQLIANLTLMVNINSGATQFGLVTYNKTVQPQFYLHTYRSSSTIMAHLRQVRFTGIETATDVALRYVQDEMFTVANGDLPSPDVIVVITDGRSSDTCATLEEARRAKLSGKHVITLGISDWVSEEELKGMASRPTSVNQRAVRGFRELYTQLIPLRDLICNNEDGCMSAPCVSGTCSDTISSYTCTCSSPAITGRNCHTECAEDADIVFALDSSDAVDDRNFRLQLSFVQDFIEGLRDTVNIAAIQFSTDAQVLFDFGAYSGRSALQEAFNTCYKSGKGANTTAALMRMRELFTTSSGTRPGRRRIGIVITSQPPTDIRSAFLEARANRNAGIDIAVIAVGSWRSQGDLAVLTTCTQKCSLYQVPGGYTQLATISSQLLDAVCNNVNHCDPNPCENGGSCVETFADYRCECPAAYQGIHCQKRCDAAMDLVFVVDSSGSIRRDRFEKIVDFMVTLVEELSIGPDETRVGVITFSDSATIVFPLNEYTVKQDVAAAMRLQMEYPGDRTHTASALALLTPAGIYSAPNGGRVGVPHLAIVFSDGNSNINERMTIPRAVQARHAGTHVIMVSIGTNVNIVEVLGMASQPHNKTVFTMESWRDLPDYLIPLGGAICDSGDYCVDNACGNGGTCVERYQRYFCSCPAPYAGPLCDVSVNCPAMDLAILVGICADETTVLQAIVPFVHTFINSINLRGGDIRVALVSFGHNVVVNFYLNEYTSVEDMLNAVAFVPWFYHCNVGNATRVLLDDVYKSSNGDRPNVTNTAVLITQSGKVRDAAAVAKQNGVDLYKVYVTDEPIMQDGYTFSIPTSGADDQAASQLLSQICN